MLRALWSRLVGARKTGAAERAAERQPKSPAERRFAEESFEDRQADTVVEERLGGVDPARLLRDDEPPRGGGGV